MDEILVEEGRGKVLTNKTKRSKTSSSKQLSIEELCVFTFRENTINSSKKAKKRNWAFTALKISQALATSRKRGQQTSDVVNC